MSKERIEEIKKRFVKKDYGTLSKEEKEYHRMMFWKSRGGEEAMKAHDIRMKRYE